MTDARAYAEAYVALGWRIVPLDPTTKRPRIDEWPNWIFDAEHVEGQNVGVILGAVSGELTDVDLDCPEALELAPFFLPPTVTFGHASKRASHWLYYSLGARSKKYWFGPKASLAKQLGIERGLVEIRASNVDGQGCGHQTVFPGSTWTSKDGTRSEPVEFDGSPDLESEIKVVDFAELTWSVRMLTLACVVLRGWSEGSGRHIKAQAISGELLHQGLTPDEVRGLFEAVQACAGDSVEEIADFGHDVETTIKKFEAGSLVTRIGTLAREAGLEPWDLDAIREYGRSAESVALELRHAASQTREGERVRRKLAHERDFGVLSDYETRIDRALKTDPVRAGQPSPKERDMAAHGPPAPVTTSWEDLPGALWDGSDEGEIPYVIPGLELGPGKVSALAAPINGGKTPYGLALAVAVALGLPFCGFETRQTNVLIYMAEGARLAKRRLSRICQGYGAKLTDLLGTSLFFFSATPGALDTDMAATLATTCKARAVGLAIVDTYNSAAAPGTDWNSQEISEPLRALGWYSDRDATTFLVLLHERKPSTEGSAGPGAGIHRIAGSVSIGGAVQSAISLSRPEGAEDRNVFSVECGREVAEAFKGHQIRWEDGPSGELCPTVVTGATGALTRAVRDVGFRVVDLLRQVPTGLTQKQLFGLLHEGVKPTGKAWQNLKSACEWACTQGMASHIISTKGKGWIYLARAPSEPQPTRAGLPGIEHTEEP